MRTVRAVLLGVGAALAAAPASGQVAVKSRAAEITVGGRVQLQGRTSSCSSFPIPESSACVEDVPAVDWFLRRVRLEVTARFNDWIEGRIQPEFGEIDRVVLRDAYGRLTLNPAARLTVGNFKRPFDGFQLISSTQILTIERDIDIPGVPGLTAASFDELTTRFNLSEWDVGIMLDGGTADDRLHYWIGTFNGNSPEENEDLNTEKQFVGRLQYSLAAGEMPLRIAAAAAYTDVPFARASGELAGRFFSAYELFAQLGDFDGGLHLQAGYLFTGNPLQNRAGLPVQLEAGEEFARARAWQAVASYRIPVRRHFFVKAVEPVFRATGADPNTALADDESWGVTGGVQLFFEGRNKVALNWDFAFFGEDSLRGENSFKVQYQFHF